ncbi:MAG: LPS biosynthesis glycosyltransferase [Pseudomonadota bacterium]
MSLAERIFRSFDRLYVINLPDRSDRRREMAGELARLGTGFDDPRVRLFAAVRPADAGPFRSVGARGAFLSQLGVLREARERGDRHILMLEDDCDMVRAIGERLPALLDRLDQAGFGFFYGGHELPEGSGALDLASGPLLRVPPELNIRLAHFLGFGPEAIDGLPAFLTAMLARPAGSPEGGPMDVDGAYNWYRRARPELATWIAVPPLGHQRPSRTDISAPGPLDRLPAPLARLARAVRRRMQRR